jgi:hypothetical protein
MSNIQAHIHSAVEKSSLHNLWKYRLFQIIYILLIIFVVFSLITFSLMLKFTITPPKTTTTT